LHNTIITHTYGSPSYRKELRGALGGVEGLLMSEITIYARKIQLVEGCIHRNDPCPVLIRFSS